MRRVRDMAQRIPLSLDEAVTRMVELSPTERFPTLGEAIDRVRTAREPEAHPLPATAADRRMPQDPDNLEVGVRIGVDYEIVSRLGQGGMAVVYAARHLVSGRTRALKIARPNDSAEEALSGEYKVLSDLDHPNVVRVLDVTKMVEGRLTLVMERVGGENLRQWMARHPAPEPPTQRRLAEDLLAGLDYLEQKGVTHKDLKPDNLLVDDGRLTIIDFSLAAVPEDALYGGTALYRDPTSARWTHGTDRFAAALCMFELYAGRHAFEGRVPEPGQEPAVLEDDIDPPGLAAFFRKALDPVPVKRFPSARAMRDAFLVALGDDVSLPVPAATVQQVEATTPLRATGLPRRAMNALARCQVQTAGELLALSPVQVRAIHAIGTKTASDIIAFQEVLRSQGVAATSATSRGCAEPPLVDDLADSPEPVGKLPLLPALRTALEQAGHPTVGAVASLTRSRLLAVPGIGPTRLVHVVEALHQFRSHGSGLAGVHTLDRIWDLAAGPLSEAQRIAVERVLGITGAPESQGAVAGDLGKSQPQVSSDISRGLERLDMSALADPLTALDNLLDGFGGIVRLDEMADRFEEAWPPGLVSGAGIVRLLIRCSPGQAHLVDVDDADGSLVARPSFDRDTLRAFSAEVARLAGQWPPIEPDTARRSLSALLPHFAGDPVALGVRLCEGVQAAESGHLFIGPLDPRQSIAFLLDQVRDPVPLEDLERRVRHVFGPDTPYPDTHHLMDILHELECSVQGQYVLPGRTSSVVAIPALRPDELPSSVGANRSPEDVVRDKLRDAASSRGFRMLIVPPERHAEIGRSVAQALDATWISFEEAFFSEHGANLAALERAERFVAQRYALAEAAEGTLFRLLREQGRPGNSVVLGDTALLGLRWSTVPPGVSWLTPRRSRARLQAGLADSCSWGRGASRPCRVAGERLLSSNTCRLERWAATTVGASRPEWRAGRREWPHGGEPEARPGLPVQVATGRGPRGRDGQRTLVEHPGPVGQDGGHRAETRLPEDVPLCPGSVGVCCGGPTVRGGLHPARVRHPVEPASRHRGGLRREVA